MCVTKTCRVRGQAQYTVGLTSPVCKQCLAVLMLARARAAGHSLALREHGHVL